MSGMYSPFPRAYDLMFKIILHICLFVFLYPLLLFTIFFFFRVFQCPVTIFVYFFCYFTEETVGGSVCASFSRLLNGLSQSRHNLFCSLSYKRLGARKSTRLCVATIC